MNYTLVALPQEKTLKKLNSIRHYLYTNGFRYTMTSPKGNAHITLLQLEISNTSFDFIGLQECLQNKLKNTYGITLKDWKIINQEHKRTSSSPELLKKYPNGCARIAVLFQDNQLFTLAEKIGKIIEPLGIDTSLAYAQNIAFAKGENITSPKDIYHYIANHMNICNYARLEKADEAVEYFLYRFTEKEISIDTLALVSEKQEIIWHFSFSPTFSSQSLL